MDRTMIQTLALLGKNNLELFCFPAAVPPARRRFRLRRLKSKAPALHQAARLDKTEIRVT